jgi:hypothetical protein
MIWLNIGTCEVAYMFPQFLLQVLQRPEGIKPGAIKAMDLKAIAYYMTVSAECAAWVMNRRVRGVHMPIPQVFSNSVTRCADVSTPLRPHLRV